MKTRAAIAFEPNKPLVVEEVDLAIHAHPTMSEAVAEAALDSLGRALNI